MKDHHNLLDSPGKSLKDPLHIATLLHGNDPQLVLLVHPHEEGLLLVVVDAPALGPVSLHAGGDQVLVPGNKEEVIVDQLLPYLSRLEYINFLVELVESAQNVPHMKHNTCRGIHYYRYSPKAYFVSY